VSKRVGPLPDLAVEYSGRGVTAYDPKTGAANSYSDLGSLGASFGGRSVVIGLSRRSVFLRTVRVPNGALHEIRQVLMIKAGDLFPLGPSELAIDFRLTDDIDEEGRLAIVAAVPTVELRRIRAEVKAAGLKLIGILPVAFGAAAVAKSLHHPSAAIVSRDSEGIGIDIVAAGEIRQSRLVAANAAVESEVCRTYTLAGIPCGPIVASGNVVLKDPDKDTNLTPLSSLIEGWASGIGVDLQLPEDVEKKLRRARDSRKRIAFMLAIIAAGFLGYVSTARSQAAALVDAQQDKNDDALAKLRKTQKAEQDVADAAKLSASTVKLAFEPAQRLGDVVTLVSNRVPEGLWLGGISVERGKPITIRGTAKTELIVAQYLQSLKAEPRLRDIRLVVTNNGQINQIPVVQFSLSAFPVGNLALSDPALKVAVKKQ